MNAERLLRIADHLEHGVMGHKFFDFNYINTNRTGIGPFDLENPKNNTCGTHGCAMGELPIIFPDTFEFRGCRVQFIHDDHAFPFSKGFQNWLDIVEVEFYSLFYPRMGQAVSLSSLEKDQNSKEIFLLRAAGIEWLDGNATKEQVASNIRKFVAYKIKVMSHE